MAGDVHKINGRQAVQQPEVVRHYVLACGAEYQNLLVLKPGERVHCRAHGGYGHLADIVRKLRKRPTKEDK
jgi:hypothetical protein